MQLVSTARRSPSQAPEGTRHAAAAADGRTPWLTPHRPHSPRLSISSNHNTFNLVNTLIGHIHVYFCYLCPAIILSHTIQSPLMQSSLQTPCPCNPYPRHAHQCLLAIILAFLPLGSLHTSQNHLTVDLVSDARNRDMLLDLPLSPGTARNPVHPRWNHSIGQSSLSHAIISPKLPCPQ